MNYNIHGNFLWAVNKEKPQTSRTDPLVVILFLRKFSCESFKIVFRQIVSSELKEFYFVIAKRKMDKRFVLYVPKVSQEIPANFRYNPTDFVIFFKRKICWRSYGNETT